MIYYSILYHDVIHYNIAYLTRPEAQAEREIEDMKQEEAWLY